jgi:hypothetical protein
VAEFARLRAERIAAEEKKIADAEAAMAELDVAPEPTSKREKKVVDTVSKRGAEYFKHSHAITDARRRKNELERMDPGDRETMLEQLKNWRGGMPTADVSKFRSSDPLERAIARVIEENQAKIDAEFTGKRNGDSFTIRGVLPKSIGIGYTLDARNQVIPTPSMMNRIVAVLVIVDDVQGHFVVETAYPE